MRGGHAERRVVRAETGTRDGRSLALCHSQTQGWSRAVLPTQLVHAAEAEGDAAVREGKAERHARTVVCRVTPTARLGADVLRISPTHQPRRGIPRV